MIDPIWESKYFKGHGQYYPWDAVVSFIKRNLPENYHSEDIKVLELGCGTGGNLSFFAREGFQVFGVDGSRTAIKKAAEYLNSLNLHASLSVGDFSPLSFKDNYFDFVIDRAALTHVGISAQNESIAEVNRILKITGKFFYSPYSKTSTSFQSGHDKGDGLKDDITCGSLVNVGQICFLDIEQVKNMFSSNWKLCSIKEKVVTQYISENNTRHSEWHVIAQKHG